MDAGAEPWQEILYRCLQGSMEMPGRAGSAHHSQPGSKFFLIPSIRLVPITQVSPAPFLLHG